MTTMNIPYTSTCMPSPLIDSLATPNTARIIASHVTQVGFSLKNDNIISVTNTGYVKWMVVAIPAPIRPYPINKNIAEPVYSSPSSIRNAISLLLMANFSFLIFIIIPSAIEAKRNL